MRFSQRIGKVASTKNIQLDSIDDDLKNGLWNIVKLFVLDLIPERTYIANHFNQRLWGKFYKLPIDTIPFHDVKIRQHIRESFFSAEWYDVYNFIEYLAGVDDILSYSDYVNTDHFIKVVNEQLEAEFSAYRFIDGIIAPISNKIEIEGVEEALNQASYFTSLKGANIHLTNALDKLSDKKNPDYRNSIKESISAIESICRILTGESTLGKALNNLESKGIKIDEQIKSGFNKLYDFTNNKESGIRHAIIEDHKSPDLDDAKYMLVVCSSFVNYIVGKCKSFDIDIK